MDVVLVLLSKIVPVVPLAKYTQASMVKSPVPKTNAALLGTVKRCPVLKAIAPDVKLSSSKSDVTCNTPVLVSRSGVVTVNGEVDALVTVLIFVTKKLFVEKSKNAPPVKGVGNNNCALVIFPNGAVGTVIVAPVYTPVPFINLKFEIDPIRPLVPSCLHPKL